MHVPCPLQSAGVHACISNSGEGGNAGICCAKFVFGSGDGLVCDCSVVMIGGEFVVVAWPFIIDCKEICAGGLLLLRDRVLLAFDDGIPWRDLFLRVPLFPSEFVDVVFPFNITSFSDGATDVVVVVVSADAAVVVDVVVVVDCALPSGPLVVVLVVVPSFPPLSTIACSTFGC